MLLLAIDLVVALCLAVQFALAGYFFYLLYWLAGLPAAADVLAAASARWRTAARAGPDPGLQRGDGRGPGGCDGGPARLAA